MTLVFSLSDYFVPYYIVCLRSLLTCISRQTKYDLYIFEQKISTESKNLILGEINGYENVVIHFVSMNDFLNEKKFSVHSHVSIETFFKLFIPTYFSTINKVLYCDSDIIFLKDPASIFELNIGNAKLAACKCHLWNGIVNHDISAFDYTTNVLSIRDVNHYFQCGVLLFNIKRISQIDCDSLLSIAQKENVTYICLDQDVLNSYFQEHDDVFFLDSCWNFEAPLPSFEENSIPYMSPQHKLSWQKAMSNPYIIHYSGFEKPWFFKCNKFSDIWWRFALDVPVYQILLIRFNSFQIVKQEIDIIRNEFIRIHFPNINSQFESVNKNLVLLYVLQHYALFYFKYRIWKFFSLFSRNDMVNHKMTLYKRLLEDSLKLKNTFLFN